MVSDKELRIKELERERDQKIRILENSKDKSGSGWIDAKKKLVKEIQQLDAKIAEVKKS